LKLKCDEPLSNCAFNFNSRRHHTGENCERITAGDMPWFPIAPGAMPLLECTVSVLAEVGRCRLTVSKPVLKACMVSALETDI